MHTTGLNWTARIKVPSLQALDETLDFADNAEV